MNSGRDFTEQELEFIESTLGADEELTEDARVVQVKHAPHPVRRRLRVLYWSVGAISFVLVLALVAIISVVQYFQMNFGSTVLQMLDDPQYRDIVLQFFSQLGMTDATALLGFYQQSGTILMVLAALVIVVLMVFLVIRARLIRWALQEAAAESSEEHSSDATTTGQQ